MDPFRLEVMEERLHRRVVRHFALAVHTLDHTLGFQPLLVASRYVFRPTIRMKIQTSDAQPLGRRALECGQRQRGVSVPRQRPTHHPTRE